MDALFTGHGYLTCNKCFIKYKWSTLLRIVTEVLSVGLVWFVAYIKGNFFFFSLYRPGMVEGKDCMTRRNKFNKRTTFNEASMLRICTEFISQECIRSPTSSGQKPIHSSFLYLSDSPEAPGSTQNNKTPSLWCHFLASSITR